MNMRFPIPFLSLQVAVAPLGKSVCELPIDRLPDPVIALENRRLNELVPELEPSILKPGLLGDSDGGSHHFDLVLGSEDEPTQYEGTVMEADESGGRLLLLRDVTARERARRAMAEAEAKARMAAHEASFLYEVASVASSEDSSEAALRGVLRLLCRHID